MYDRGLKPSVQFEVPVISVGNLSVGGTGKTPMIEYLVRLLQAEHKVASLSRGYGRKSRGFRIAEPKDNAQTLGDEPFQLYKKYGTNITVSVGEERALAIPLILQDHEDIQVILLDDARAGRIGQRLEGNRGRIDALGHVGKPQHAIASGQGHLAAVANQGVTR